MLHNSNNIVNFIRDIVFLYISFVKFSHLLIITCLGRGLRSLSALVVIYIYIQVKSIVNCVMFCTHIQWAVDSRVSEIVFLGEENSCKRTIKGLKQKSTSHQQMSIIST